MRACNCFCSLGRRCRAAARAFRHPEEADALQQPSTSTWYPEPVGFSFHSCDSHYELDSAASDSVESRVVEAGKKRAELPATSRPTGRKPDHKQRLPGATLSSVMHALEDASDQWPLQQHLAKEMRAINIEGTPWVEVQYHPHSSQARGSASSSASEIQGKTWERRVRFRMPLPPLPRALSYMVKMPKTSSVTGIYSLRQDTEELTLLQRICTHEAPMGDRFWAQETTVFRMEAGEIGVTLEKWSEVVDVVGAHKIPSLLRGYIEKQVKEKGKAAAVFTAKLLENVMAPLPA